VQLAVAALLLAVFAAMTLGQTRGRRQAIMPAIVTVVLIVTAIAIWVRWQRESQGPFLTLYDVLLSNVFSLTLVFLCAYLLVRAIRPAAVVILPVLLLLGVWLLMAPPQAIPLPPTFDNNWLWLHVISGKIFFGLCLTAAGASLLLIIKSIRKAPPSGNIDNAIWKLMSLAFVCNSLMLIAGAVWAYSAWGRYWAWDSLEIWALLTWLSLGLLLHARITFRQLPSTYLWAGNLLVFVLAFLTFLGIPFISVAPHKGIM
jgi:ABC-type transport system involved in cytochrome c biogenesis permease subunit